nr:hypothetical protein [Tanacetum cinerariifolium]
MFQLSTYSSSRIPFRRMQRLRYTTSNWMNSGLLNVDILFKALKITHVDSAHLFELPLAGKVVKVRKGKTFEHLVDEEEVQHVTEPQMEDYEYDLQRDLQNPKKKSTTNQYIFQRRTPATHEASTGPYAQPQDDTFANMVCDTPSLANAKTDADIKKTNHEADTKILNVGEEQGEDVSNMVALEERTMELNKGQVGSDPGKTLESRPPPEHVIIEKEQAGSNPGQSHEHVHIENPPSSSKTLSSIKNLDDPFTFETQAPGKDDSSSFIQGFTLENHDLHSKIEKYVNETVKEDVHNVLQAPIHERFRELSKFEMKEILHDRMFESGSYRSYPEHSALYDALESSTDRGNREEFLEEITKSRKRCCDNQDSLLPPPKDSDQNKKKRHDSDASNLKQPLVQTSLAWKTSDIREAPSSSSKQKSASPFEQPVDDVPIPDDDVHLSKSEDTGDKERRSDLSISKPKVAYYPDFGLEELISSLWIESERDYDTSTAYCISHCWFKRNEFYITRHSARSDLCAVRSHMRIVSVVSLKTFSRYGYTYLKEIVLQRADYKEYKISEADFKNLHPNDFEDLNLLHLQGKLNHLSGANKVHLFNAINLYIRNIVIRHRVKDLQLRIKSYQTKLNLLQPSWDAFDF